MWRPKGERRGKGSAWSREKSQPKPKVPKPGEIWEVHYASGGIMRFIVVRCDDEKSNLWTIFTHRGRSFSYFNFNDDNVGWFAS